MRAFHAHTTVIAGTDPSAAGGLPSLEQIPRLPQLILHGGQASLTGRQADLVRNDIGLLGWVFGRISRESPGPVKSRLGDESAHRCGDVLHQSSDASDRSC